MLSSPFDLLCVDTVLRLVRAGRIAVSYTSKGGLWVKLFIVYA